MDDILSTNNKLKDIEKNCKKMEEEKDVERRQLQELGRKIGENKIITIYQSSEPTYKFDGNKEQNEKYHRYRRFKGNDKISFHLPCINLIFQQRN